MEADGDFVKSWLFGWAVTVIFSLLYYLFDPPYPFSRLLEDPFKVVEFVFFGFANAPDTFNFRISSDVFDWIKMFGVSFIYIVFAAPVFLFWRGLMISLAATWADSIREKEILGEGFIIMVFGIFGSITLFIWFLPVFLIFKFTLVQN
jgi:hypothetical protein